MKSWLILPLSTHFPWAPFSASAPALPHTEKQELLFSTMDSNLQAAREGAGTSGIHEAKQILTGAHPGARHTGEYEDLCGPDL